jgi:inner membrane protein
MLGHSHVAIAGALWAALWWRPLALGGLTLAAPEVALGHEVPPALSSLVVVAIGALLPDLDHPRAVLAQWRPAGEGWFRFFQPLLLPAVALRETFGHRGGLHSLPALAAVWLGGEYLAQRAGIPGLVAALGWGYAAHLLADMATRRGVPLLWPLTRRRLGLPRPLAVRTGSLGEALYLAAIGAITALYLAGIIPPLTFAPSW